MNAQLLDDHCAELLDKLGNPNRPGYPAVMHQAPHQPVVREFRLSDLGE